MLKYLRKNSLLSLKFSYNSLSKFQTISTYPNSLHRALEANSREHLFNFYKNKTPKGKMTEIGSSIAFTVTRSKPELVAPAKLNPHELKPLSDIDESMNLRYHTPIVFFYKNNLSMVGKDPVRVIKEALAKALVYYYPLAGRLIEGSNKKLSVDCNGEGVLFLEASADITLEQLGDSILSPHQYLDEVLHNVPGSDDIIGCPIILVQVNTFNF